MSLKAKRGTPGAVNFKVVNELPTENIDESAIYMKPSGNPEETNTYEEFIYVNGVWESLGVANVEIDLTDYVKKTDYALNGEAGVFKTLGNGNYGLWVNPDGSVKLKPATKGNVDSARVWTDQQYYPLVYGNAFEYAVMLAMTDPIHQEWTDDQKTAARTLLDAVGSADYATNSKAGLMKVGNGLYANNEGTVVVQRADDAEIDAKSTGYKPITPKTIDYAVMKALTDSKNHTWTEEQKKVARDTLGVKHPITITSFFLSGSESINYPIVLDTSKQYNATLLYEYEPFQYGIRTVEYLENISFIDGVLTLPNSSTESFELRICANKFYDASTQNKIDKTDWVCVESSVGMAFTGYYKYSITLTEA